MATINLDDNTAKKLSELATAQGMTIDAYVKSLIPSNRAPPITAEEFEAELEALSFHGPPLPEGFSRADIYFDHY